MATLATCSLARHAAGLQRQSAARPLVAARPAAPRSSFASRLQVTAVAGEGNARGWESRRAMQGPLARLTPASPLPPAVEASLRPHARRGGAPLVVRQHTHKLAAVAVCAAHRLSRRLTRPAAPDAAPAAPSKAEPSYSGAVETYAVVEIGGHQLIVEEGRWYTVNRLEVREGW